MAQSGLQARPIYHRKRDSTGARLSIVFAALAAGRRIEHQAGWSIRKFVKTARRYRTIQIQADDHIIIIIIITTTTAAPLPDDPCRWPPAAAKARSATARLPQGEGKSMHAPWPHIEAR